MHRLRLMIRELFLVCFSHLFPDLVVMATEPITDPSVPLLKEPNLTFNGKRETRSILWRRMLAVVYSLFLCWQLIGMCLYLVRAATCFKHKVPTYKCDINAAFKYSAELQLCYLLCVCLHLTLAIIILPKISAFPGYEAVVLQLKNLPQFWSLCFFLLAASFRYLALCILGTFGEQTTFYYPLLISFALCNILKAVVVCAVNFTKLSPLKKKSARTLFVFSKLTILVIFIENLLRFMVSLLAFSMNAKDLMQDEKVHYSSDVLVVFFFLEKFGTSCFHYKIMNFFWKKLFYDESYVLLGHHSPQQPCTQASSRYQSYQKRLGTEREFSRQV